MHKVRIVAHVAAILGVLTPLLVASQASAATWYLAYWGDYGTDTMISRVLTPDGSDAYTITKSITNNIGNMYMSANAGNTGGNLRKVIYAHGSSDYLNSQSCATWVTSSAESVQEGLAMRIVNSGSTTRAITVTKNVIYGVHWVFNVHTWDSSQSQAFNQVAQFDMADAVFSGSQLKAKPWRACARVIGENLQFKIWFPFQGQSEPAWDDAVYARSATVPSAWSQAGKVGWYVGHIGPNQSAHYNGLTTYTYQ